MMNGEFFPLEAKGKNFQVIVIFCNQLQTSYYASSGTASSISTAFNWTCAFLVTKYEVKLEEAIGTYGAYFLFSGNKLVIAVSTRFMLTIFVQP